IKSMVKIIKFPQRLKTARVIAQLSQSDLAEKLGISPKTVSAYEQGRVIPPVPTLQKIAEITDQPVDFFMDKKKNIGDDEITRLENKLEVIINELKNISKKMR